MGEDRIDYLLRMLRLAPVFLLAASLIAFAGTDPAPAGIPAPVPMNSVAQSAAAPKPAPAPPPIRVELGSDHNVCGLTVPAVKPRKKIGLIVWFHGGMRSQNREKGLEAHRGLLYFVDPKAYYLCSPSAFAGDDWLSPQAVPHTDALIDYMLAHYPIDTTDINLVGVSDGCLAAIRYSMDGKHAVRRRVLISSLPQLAVPPEELAAQTRFATGTWDFFQGGRDRLFPVDAVMPYLQQWEKTFPNVRVHFFPDGEHDFFFYAERAPELLRGIFAKPRSDKPLQNSK